MTSETHRVLDKPLMSFDIAHELEEMKAGEQWKTSHRGAKTLAKNEDVRLVLVALSKGMTVHEHQAEGPITVSVAEGSIRFIARGEERTLARGALLTLGAGIAHQVDALEDSAFVVTVIQPHHAQR
ncbi:MAG TPA: cupin domain-containing protein [Candidatus Binataceae bacterium]|nr:cupin domain-containing protein [Candidatus Binataceae bacterium]